MEIKVQKVSTDWSDMPGGLTYYIIGQPKSGKTTAAASWSPKGQSGVLLIDTDLGADFVEGANQVIVTSLNPPMRPIEKDGKKVIKDGKEQYELVPPSERGYYQRSGPNKGKPAETHSLAEIYMWLEEKWQELPYDTIAIDTIDVCNKWIEEIVCDELNINAMGDGQWGADWGQAKRKNLDLIKRFQALIKKHGGYLIMISHAKSTQIQDGKVQLAPELPRGLGYALTAQADVIGYATVQRQGDGDDTEHMISFINYDERTVGSRLKPLAHKRLPFNYESIQNEILTYREE